MSEYYKMKLITSYSVLSASKPFVAQRIISSSYRGTNYG